jgi:hypothetical protein
MSPTTETLLAAANPVDDETVRGLDLGDAPSALRDAIVAAAIADEPHARTASQPRSRRLRRRPVVVFAGLACGVAIALGFTGLGHLGGSGDDGSGQAWAASALRIANAVPRLLVDEPGWKVTGADDFSKDYGNVTFTAGTRSVELDWYPKRQHAMYLEDRRAGTKHLGTAPTASGSTAELFGYSADDMAAIWLQGDYSLEIRTKGYMPPAERGKPVFAGEGGPVYATGFTLASFKELLADLHVVSVDDWLSAMPASVVKPDQQTETVARMLEDIPLPPGFDPRTITPSATGVRDRYQLGAKVEGAVACAWIERWIDAKGRGDAATQHEAIDALRSNGTWKLTKEMQPEGAYPSVLDDYARAMASGDAPPAGSKTTVEASYRQALGCR